MTTPDFQGEEDNARMALENHIVKMPLVLPEAFRRNAPITSFLIDNGFMKLLPQAIGTTILQDVSRQPAVSMDGLGEERPQIEMYSVPLPIVSISTGEREMLTNPDNVWEKLGIAVEKLVLYGSNFEYGGSRVVGLREALQIVVGMEPCTKKVPVKGGMSNLKAMCIIVPFIRA